MRIYNLVAVHKGFKPMYAFKKGELIAFGDGQTIYEIANIHSKFTDRLIIADYKMVLSEDKNDRIGRIYKNHSLEAKNFHQQWLKPI